VNSRRVFLSRVSLLSCQGFASDVFAQTFPMRQIRFVVPFSGGGAADIFARLISKQITNSWGQPVLVDLKPGGGTVIGTSIVANSPPDGYTILFIANSFVINAKLRPSLPYDGIKAFAPVALMVDSPQVIVVNASRPYRTLKELIEAAKAHPGEISIGTNGPATAQHIATELLQRAAGIKMNYIPFGGAGPALNAVLGGHLDVVLCNLGDVTGFVEAGKLRPLAVSTQKRLELLKDVPTVSECGFPDYAASAWFGVAVPLGTPTDVVAKLSLMIRNAMKDPEIEKKMNVLNLLPNYKGPTEFKTHIAEQYEQYSRVIDAANIKVE
jgi:tripartite-type tricarboxylate transporter receptor subunit TctC